MSINVEVYAVHAENEQFVKEFAQSEKVWYSTAIRLLRLMKGEKEE